MQAKTHIFPNRRRAHTLERIHHEMDDDFDPAATQVNNSSHSLNRESSSISSSSYSSMPKSEIRMKRMLKFYFMNPCEKFRAKGRKPWKLGLQIVKIILVTIQLVVFGASNQSVVGFKETSRVAFSHNFLEDWQPNYDYKTYPSTDGYYAIYQTDDFYKKMGFVFHQFVNISGVSVGQFKPHIPEESMDCAAAREGNSSGVVDAACLSVCTHHYSQVNFTYIDLSKITSCKAVVLDSNTLSNSSDYQGDAMAILQDSGILVDFERLVGVNLEFYLQAIHLDTEATHVPDIYIFKIMISFDNSKRDGKMDLSLDSETYDIRHYAYDLTPLTDQNSVRVGYIAMDCAVITLCTLSALLCFRSIFKAQRLKRITQRFFSMQYSHTLTNNEKLRFVNFWFVMITISDVLTVSGSVFKIEIEMRKSTDYDICSILLGTACLLVWFGILNYLEFFPKYNILIVTMTRSLPSVLRFSVCAAFMYFGYAFLGWVVLGPYHYKFRSFNVASECMFSLINGDDMFATFAEMSEKSAVVWVYSRLYLYTFISLFIYVVLSLFISVIMDTYETVKEYRDDYPQSSLLDKFLADDKQMASLGSYNQDDESCCFFCLCHKHEEGTEEERRVLID